MVEQGPQHAATVVPDTVQAVLAARLDRLLPEAKRLLQAAAVIGHEVPLPVLQAITACPSEVLHRSVHHLQVAECLVETRLHPERIYTFKHALTQEVAYQSLVQHTRQRYHAQVAQVLVEHFPETVEAQPERVAHHYTAAGLGAQAVPYWHQAGQRAMARSASAEAISHLTHGIEILQTLPVTPERTQQELRLQITLGTPLRRLQGNKASEVERVYARALEMYRQVEDSPQRFEALTGLWSFAMERGRASMARDLAEIGRDFLSTCAVYFPSLWGMCAPRIPPYRAVGIAYALVPLAPLVDLYLRPMSRSSALHAQGERHETASTLRRQSFPGSRQY